MKTCDKCGGGAVLRGPIPDLVIPNMRVTSVDGTLTVIRDVAIPLPKGRLFCPDCRTMGVW